MTRSLTLDREPSDESFGCNPVGCQAGMHELAQPRSGLGGRIVWMDSLEWRRRCVLQQELRVFGDSLTEDFGDRRQGEIHAGGDATARNDVASADDAALLDDSFPARGSLALSNAASEFLIDCIERRTPDGDDQESVLRIDEHSCVSF
jgi:hypothetical protein